MSNLYRQDYEPPKMSRAMRAEHTARKVAFEAGAWMIFTAVIAVVVLKWLGLL